MKRWAGIRPALHFAPDCAQLPTPGDAAPLRTVSREDCLYLNVWRPRALSARGLPVMVWIYGGGFVDGGTSPAVYDGTDFARDGIVLVSGNYRLGNFGFFAFPPLSRPAAGGLLADYTFMDQIAALQWVRRNAASFGGDPRNVTIFGESAGGMSVNALLMSPLARGLFAKAIIESGGGRGNIHPLRHLSGSADSAQAMGGRLAWLPRSRRPRAPPALAALRALPAARLVDGLDLADRERTIPISWAAPSSMPGSIRPRPRRFMRRAAVLACPSSSAPTRTRSGRRTCLPPSAPIGGWWSRPVQSRDSCPRAASACTSIASATLQSHCCNTLSGAPHCLRDPLCLRHGCRALRQADVTGRRGHGSHRARVLGRIRPHGPARCARTARLAAVSSEQRQAHGLH